MPPPPSLSKIVNETMYLFLYIVCHRSLIIETDEHVLIIAYTVHAYICNVL